MLNAEELGLLVEGRVEARYQAVSNKYGQHVVAPLSLGSRFVDLPSVGEIEKHFDQIAVPHQVIQRRNKGCARRSVAAPARGFQRGQVAGTKIEFLARQALDRHTHQPAVPKQAPQSSPDLAASPAYNSAPFSVD